MKEEIKEYIEELESLFDLCAAASAYESLQGVKSYIENLQSQLKAKEEIFEEAISYIRGCCDMDSKWVNLHYDYAQKEMSADKVDGLLEILSKGENNG